MSNPSVSSPPYAIGTPSTKNDPATAPSSSPGMPRRSNPRKRALRVIIGFLVVYLVLAYVILPLGWERYAHRHPVFENVARITHTGNGIPGDPLNVALVGSEREVKAIMQAAKWFSADPLNLRSSLEMVESSVLKRQYESAPVSNLYLEGRKEDLAFEQAVGDSPRHRHHVRFWRLDRRESDGRPIWIGSAVYDLRVGLSRTTGQVTHVTAADVDTERDYLFRDLVATGDLAKHYAIDNFHTQREGRNGGGDPWRTDGKLYVGVITRGLVP